MEEASAIGALPPPLEAEHSLENLHEEAGDATADPVDDAVAEFRAEASHAFCFVIFHDNTLMIIAEAATRSQAQGEGDTLEGEDFSPSEQTAEAQEAVPADADDHASGEQAAADAPQDEPSEGEGEGEGQPPVFDELGRQERLASAEAAGPIEPERELSPLEACVRPST